MDIKKAIVLGAGTMGIGIAQVVAQKGIQAVLVDVKKDILQGALNKVEKGMLRRVEKGKMTKEQVQDIMSRITVTTDIEAVSGCDFV
ncbi:MAG: 3-hydroxyacyl-CoA dehydrogenase NAD-binding domain-containing protein, partial [Firmicutes bacterium]|nr:3-hydroxyacyl-CoA dehydrogenase NAD-binding domain-containing protein [Bacillota bacterium]